MRRDAAGEGPSTKASGALAGPWMHTRTHTTHTDTHSTYNTVFTETAGLSSLSRWGAQTRVFLQGNSKCREPPSLHGEVKVIGRQEIRRLSFPEVQWAVQERFGGGTEIQLELCIKNSSLAQQVKSLQGNKSGHGLGWQPHGGVQEGYQWWLRSARGRIPGRVREVGMTGCAT